MQTVIGVFENAHEAQKAAQHLVSNGFTEDNVDLSIRGNNTDITSSSMGSNTSSPDTSMSGGDGDTYRTGYTQGSDIGSDSLERSSSMSDSGEAVYGTDRRDSTGYDERRDDDDSFGDKVSRFFRNLFGGDDDDNDKANRYSHVASRTGCIVTVYAQSRDEAERAADILDEYGAIDVDQRAGEYGYSGSGGRYDTGSLSDDDRGAPFGTADTLVDSDRSTSGTMYDADDTSTRRDIDDADDVNERNEKLNVIREDVQIGKREVQTGGVRLRSRIVERPVEESLRLREERVTVERTPVDRPATTADFQNFREGEIEMTERAEVADVSKEARVVEEVTVAKEVNERKETVRETARDTQVDVENLGSNDVNRTRDRDRDL